MTVRLAFTGASGTGKSTLATRISSEFGIPMCPVGSREVAKSLGFDNPYDVDKAGKRREFQQRLVDMKRVWERDHPDGFVTDRTHFDNLAYTTIHDEALADHWAFRDTVIAAMCEYTHIVFCPTGSFINLDGDPARVADPDYHQRYETILWRLFIEHQRGVYQDMLVLGSSNLQDRIEKVRSFVRT